MQIAIGIGIAGIAFRAFRMLSGSALGDCAAVAAVADVPVLLRS